MPPFPPQKSFVFLLKAARPGFWLTTIWFYLLPLAHRPAWQSAEFWLGMFYVTFPLGLLIYGWNDLVDVEADRWNPRKDTFLFGARPTSEQIATLPRWIAAIQLPFVLLFTWLLGARALVWFAGIVLSTALYNGPRGRIKSLPGVDVLIQAAYLLVFVLSSWINGAPQLPWFTWIFGALFAMHSHLFGQIMDLDPDRAAGRRSTAVVLGSIRAKWLLTAILAGESVLIAATAHDCLIAGALAIGAGWFALDAGWLWRDRAYEPRQMRFFLLGWNAAAVVSAPLVWARGSLAGFQTG
jgi:4-hydroxybenzoate polyprenyltransferase